MADARSLSSAGNSVSWTVRDRYFAASPRGRDNFAAPCSPRGADNGARSESESPQLDLIGMGGTLRSSPWLWPQAVAGIETHFADQVVFSVAGLTDDGHLTDPDPLEAQIKRSMIRRARRAILLVDDSKFDRAALSVIADVAEINVILAAGISDRSLMALRRAGVEVSAV